MNKFQVIIATNEVLAFLIKKLSVLQYTVYIQKQRKNESNIGSLCFQSGFSGIIYTAIIPVISRLSCFCSNMLRFSYIQIYWFELDTAKVRLHKLRLINSLYCNTQAFYF